MKYHITFEMGMTDAYIQPMLNYLRKKGFDPSFSFDDDRHSCELSVNKELGDCFDVIAESPHVTGLYPLKPVPE